MSLTSSCKVVCCLVTFGTFCTLPQAATAQSVPILVGEIETVWTSDRTSWLEGPSYDGANGIWFGDPGNIETGFAEPSRLLRYDASTGETSIQIAGEDGNIFGTTFDASGQLLATHLDQLKLTRRDPTKLAEEEILASQFRETPLLPNDLVLDSSGGIYFTDWKQNTPPELGDSGVYYLPTDGPLQLATSVPQTQSANGIAISPDQTALYVARPFAGGVFRHDILSPGVLGEGQLFAPSPTGADGITTDRHGNVYVPQLGADPETGMITAGLPDASVSVFSPAGKLLLQFAPPGGAINLTFDDQDNLYMTGWSRLTRAEVSFVPEPSSTFNSLVAIVALTALRVRRKRCGPPGIPSATSVWTGCLGTQEREKLSHAK